MQKKKASYWQYILLVCILGSIFILSSQAGQDSHKLSNHFIKIYEEIVIRLPMISPATQNLLLVRADHYVRKVAHFTIYMILGGVMVSILKQTRQKFMGRIMTSLICCSLYAATDEWHQYYVVGRGAQISDVIIDSCGALIGIVIAAAIMECMKGSSNRLED